MAFFAQLDIDNICIGILDLVSNPNDPLYYPIATYDLSLLGQQYLGNGDNTQTIDITDFEDGEPDPYNPNDTTNPNSPTNVKCLKFPETIVDNGNLNLRGNRMTSYNSDSGTFWSNYDNGGTHEYWDSIVFKVKNNTSFQTMIEIEGEGILTNVISPSPKSSNSTITYHITLDDVLYEFVSRDNDANRRYCLGYYAPDYDGSDSDDDDDKTGYPMSSWKEGDREIYVLIPPTALQRGQSGLKFKESMKIEVQCSSGWSTSQQDEYSGASYLTYIPFGV